MDDRSFGKMEGRMDGQEERLVRIEKKVDQILEWRWKMWGVTAAVAIICSGLFEIIIACFQDGKGIIK